MVYSLKESFRLPAGRAGGGGGGGGGVLTYMAFELFLSTVGHCLAVQSDLELNVLDMNCVCS